MDEQEREAVRDTFDRWMTAQTAHIPRTPHQGEMTPPTSLAERYIREQSAITRAAREQHGRR